MYVMTDIGRAFTNIMESGVKYHNRNELTRSSNTNPTLVFGQVGEKKKGKGENISFNYYMI